ncbi:hypothetical protein SLNWT_7080 [Streptomyces albus]|uniref:SpaA-like prealbumin fold domain-containing protein n=1 Tax=Streptomyces albus (strain ATCC 21838 / DSM 41398 / FERM P-419 / JCM 4703 / NBRC 107858) TaxID=1081613 RepID=A0A0B5F9E3_STRA4|nr:hypothetical protein SLNWT_7080 [Streptomyces albus]AOU81759.1 hypothetical protein SLNHY_7068 [Streptomyces albus]AYN37448.1 ligand-binding membrane protein [Streptomyces albus]
MHAPLVRTAALIIVGTGILTWAPAANAQPLEPTPAASADPAETPNPGSIEITTKDTAGELLSGAAFLLLDATGQETARGETDAQGKLTFPDLTPGVYRLTETASGSPIHEVVADQDVIVTPGASTRLTITDPFKPAKILLQTRDNKTGKLLPGATVNIGTGGKTLLTLTTGSKGTASGTLPVSSRTTQFWAKEIKAPAGYDLTKATKTFTAGPGAPTTVTLTNSKTASEPKPDPSGKPVPTPGKPSKGRGGATPSMSGTDSPGPGSAVPATPAGAFATKTPTGALAHTGAEPAPWLIAGTAALIAVGGGVLLLARRSRINGRADDSTKR